MIEKTFEESFTPEWKENNITDKTNELVILREIIPWQEIINRLIPFYSSTKGRKGISLRTVVAVLIIAKLRTLSDGEVVRQVKENRYYSVLLQCRGQRSSDFH